MEFIKFIWKKGNKMALFSVILGIVILVRALVNQGFDLSLLLFVVWGTVAWLGLFLIDLRLQIVLMMEDQERQKEEDRGDRFFLPSRED